MEIARDAISVGVSYAEMKRFEDALRHYDQGLRIARLLGDVRLVMFAQLDRAGALADLGRWSEARPVMVEAERLSALLGEKANRGFIAVGRGQIEMALGHWRRAVDQFEFGLQTLRDHGSPYELVRALADVGGYYEQRGEREVAIERWGEALTIARKLRNDALASDLARKLSLIPTNVAVSPSVARDSGQRASGVPAAGSWC